MDAFEERRHKIVLADMVGPTASSSSPSRPTSSRRDPEWAFMRSGYSECIDSFFGFGLFKIAKDTGFFPPELIDTFEPVMREEGRHILFFVNWVAWWRRNMPLWRRPWFELKVIAVWVFLICERIDMAKGMGRQHQGAGEQLHPQRLEGAGRGDHLSRAGARSASPRTTGGSRLTTRG